MPQHDQPPLSRRHARVLRQSSTDRGHGPSFDREGEQATADRHRQKKRRRWIWTLTITIVVAGLLVAGGVAAKRLYDQAMGVRTHLLDSMAEVSGVQSAVLAGDLAAAAAASDRLVSHTEAAVAGSGGRLWSSAQLIPIIGENLEAVRQVSVTTNQLAHDVVAPATAISLDALRPQGGRIDLEAIDSLSTLIEQIDIGINEAATSLATIDRGALIEQVSSGLDQLDQALAKVQPVIQPLRDIFGVLPDALGSEDARNYLLVFQNNAESRGTGGNPAAMVIVIVDDGQITLGQQASSADFRWGITEPIMPLSPETEALYGSKIGRWISDATLTPDFSETSAIIRAWWADSFGSPIDGVISFDPVALGYILEATGPAEVAAEPMTVDGRTVQLLDEPVTLTADSAADFLLNQIYWDHPGGPVQDAIYAASARSVFDALIQGNAKPLQLIDAFARAIDESRLLYAPSSQAEADLIADSKLSGMLPTSNDAETVVGVYVNDTTTSKLDYYAQLDISADMSCTSTDPSYSVTARFENTVSPQLAAALPRGVAPAYYYPKGDIATTLVIYGPVGSEHAGTVLDGAEISAKAFPHLGRPAVRIPIYNAPEEVRTITVEFTTTGDGAHGPLEVRHTPMVRETNVETSSCDQDDRS